MASRNKGHQYEDTIKALLSGRNLLPASLLGNDAGFIHKGIDYYVEVKNVKAPDFGQKGLVWSKVKGWEWRQKDIVTDLYDGLGVTTFIDKDFVPRRYSMAQGDLTAQDRSYDQNRFEKSGITLSNIDCLYEYYARKSCFYIQVEGRGFYYLKEDRAGLNVPQFNPRLTLRLRAKTHHSIPIYKYSFFAVIQPKLSEISPSTYDLEEKVGKFPPIKK